MKDRPKRQRHDGIHANGNLVWPAGSADAALSLDNKPGERSSATELLTIAEAAAFLTISRSSVRRLQQGRRLAFFKVGGSLRFAKSDLASYLAGQRIGSLGK